MKLDSMFSAKTNSKRNVPNHSGHPDFLAETDTILRGDILLILISERKTVVLIQRQRDICTVRIQGDSLISRATDSDHDMALEPINSEEMLIPFFAEEIVI